MFYPDTTSGATECLTLAGSKGKLIRVFYPTLFD